MILSALAKALYDAYMMEKTITSRATVMPLMKRIVFANVLASHWLRRNLTSLTVSHRLCRGLYILGSKLAKADHSSP
jgi:hypothetical protein